MTSSHLLAYSLLFQTQSDFHQNLTASQPRANSQNQLSRGPGDPRTTSPGTQGGPSKVALRDWGGEMRGWWPIPTHFGRLQTPARKTICRMRRPKLKLQTQNPFPAHQENMCCETPKTLGSHCREPARGTTAPPWDTACLLYPAPEADENGAPGSRCSYTKLI